MSLRKPPALATWLLNRVRLSETNPPLAGDLLEEFQTGRSSAWYWRQTAKAITTTLGHNLRQSRPRLPGIFFGWVIQASIATAFWRFYSPGIPARLFVPATMIAISTLFIILVALGDGGIKKLSHVLDPLGTRFTLLAVFMGMVLGNDGMSWTEFVFVLCLWLGGFLLFTALRPPKNEVSLHVPEARLPAFKGVFKGWFVQQVIANALRNHNLPAQLPLQFLIPGALIILSAVLILRLAIGNSVRKKLISALYRPSSHVALDRVVRLAAYLTAYCLIALCVQLTLNEFLLLECAFLLLDVTFMTRLLPKSETA